MNSKTVTTTTPKPRTGLQKRADALRGNLLKRKKQARARSEPPASSGKEK